MWTRRLGKETSMAKLVDITLIVDRSGSMASCLEDAEGGINTFIKEQKKEKGKAVFSLIQFDAEYETVHSGIDMKSVPKYTLVPRGRTALFDSIGKGINDAKDRINDMTTEPDCVIFVIITDGQENASKEFKKDQIKKIIEDQTDAGWQFTFLGADQAAFDEAVSMGIAVASVALYDSDERTSTAYMAASSNVSRMRGAVESGFTVSNTYTEEEREAMKS